MASTAITGSVVGPAPGSCQALAGRAPAGACAGEFWASPWPGGTWVTSSRALPVPWGPATATRERLALSLSQAGQSAIRLLPAPPISSRKNRLPPAPPYPSSAPLPHTLITIGMPHHTRLSPAAHHFAQADDPGAQSHTVTDSRHAAGHCPARRRCVLASAPALTTWLLSQA